MLGDKILSLHKGSNINKFRIRCTLDNSHGRDITNWIYTATAKKVQNFELDFWPPSHINDYAFPLEQYNFLKRGHGLSSIKSLRSLCLNSLKVSGEALECFIHSCPHLEHLYVDNSSELLSLKVVGSPIPLKYLDIHYCYSMKEIEISASSLVSFRYSGKYIKLHVGNVPQLVDVVIHGAPLFQIRYFIGSVVCCFPQLKTLDLECCNEVSTVVLWWLCMFLEIFQVSCLSFSIFSGIHGIRTLGITQTVAFKTYHYRT